MRKIILVLTMLYCPSVFAATLAANNIPYVCQGGTSPQLCNSTITSNGNIGIGSSNPGQMLDVQGTIRALGYSNSLSLVSASSLSSVSSVTFNALTPGVTYKLILNLLQNTTSGYQTLQINGDNGNNYTSVILTGINTSSYSYYANNINSFQLTYSSTTFASYYSQFEITFQTVPGNNNKVQYTVTSGNYGSGSSTYLVNIGYGIYTGSSPLSSVTFLTSAGTVTGTARLYQYN